MSHVSASVYLCRYLEVSGDLLEEEAQQKLVPTALSCFLNTAACNLKLQLWQDAVDSCNEVPLLVGGGGGASVPLQQFLMCFSVFCRVYRFSS